MVMAMLPSRPSQVATDGLDRPLLDVRWPAICYDRLVYRIEKELV